MRIAILGANGFIGRHVVAQAAARHGSEAVIAMGRRRGDPGQFPPGIEQRILDVTHAGTADNALHDVTHLVNCVMGSRDAILQSTAVALRAAEHHRLERIVHLSSIAVHGAREGLVPEDAAPGEAEDDYGAAKIDAERRIGLSPVRDRVTVLRPGLVYGPGSELWSRRIARLLLSGRIGDLGAQGRGIASLVHVGDVAQACVEALTAAEAAGRAFHLVMSDPPAWNRYLTDFAKALGVEPRRISPARLRAERLAAYPLQMWKLYGGRWSRHAPAMITPGLARLFSRGALYENSAATRLLVPQWHDYTQGLEESAR